jgi:hypothetical protein
VGIGQRITLTARRAPLRTVGEAVAEVEQSRRVHLGRIVGRHHGEEVGAIVGAVAVELTDVEVAERRHEAERRLGEGFAQVRNDVDDAAAVRLIVASLTAADEKGVREAPRFAPVILQARGHELVGHRRAAVIDHDRVLDLEAVHVALEVAAAPESARARAGEQ